MFFGLILCIFVIYVKSLPKGTTVVVYRANVSTVRPYGLFIPASLSSRSDGSVFSGFISSMSLGFDQTRMKGPRQSKALPVSTENTTSDETQLPKTNLIMTVSYDGTEYAGFVGPMLFLKSYGIDKGYPSKVSSVCNELLRAITTVHGYFSKRKRIKCENSAEIQAPKSRNLGTGCDGTRDKASETENSEEWVADTCDSEDFERRFSLITSSRTDKGVHSLDTACQYLSFDRAFPFENLDHFHDSLNKLLPNDIRVTSVIKSPTDEFHVRHHNIGKVYTYKIDLSPSPSLFERKYQWQLMADKQFRNTLLNKYNSLRAPFCIDKLRESARVFEGTHNFQGFRRMSRGNERNNVIDPICTIYRIDVDFKDGDSRLEINISGNRFLYKMVRCITSHLVLAGFNVLKPKDIKEALDVGTEIPNIQCAPAHGLYLKNVFFEQETQARINEAKERYLRRLNKTFN